MNRTRWHWMRHAPVPDPEARIVGQLDMPADLSDTDWIKAVANRIPARPILVQSSLLRVNQTVAALEASGLMLPPPIVDDALIEQNFGCWQGHSWGELSSAKDPDLPAFWKDPAYAIPPGGESFASQVDRVSAFVRHISQTFAGRDILAVAHAGTIRAALAQALDIKPEKALAFDVKPLSLTRIDVMDPDGYSVRDVNWLPE